KHLSPILFANFATDKTVRMLSSIKIFERFLIGENLKGILPIHQHKHMSPHKDMIVELGSHIIGHKTAFRSGLPQVTQGYLPGFPIAVNKILMTAPVWLWQPCPGLCKAG